VYTLARSIDYHERNPWAVVWAALTSFNEMFVYREWAPNPAGGKWTNEKIAMRIAAMSGEERFVMNLIDPYANKVQTNTGITVVGDLNEAFWKARREGIGMGGFWEPFDTKGTVGRDAIRMRLHNATKCKRPLNNQINDGGRDLYLPTLWVLRSCPQVAKSLKQWRYDEWAAKELVHKDRKEQPSQKFSHFCTALEGILKDNRFNIPRRDSAVPRSHRPQYFKVRKTHVRSRRSNSIRARNRR
jgi:hypothetical protein